MSKENSYVKRDYRHIALEILADWADEFPEMSLGEILYSIIRNSANGLGIENTYRLTDIEDKAWYEICEKQFKFERE